MKTEEAKKFLEENYRVETCFTAVFHKQKVHHQKAIGPEVFEESSELHAQGVKNVENNAEYKGFDVENMKLLI